MQKRNVMHTSVALALALALVLALALASLVLQEEITVFHTVRRFRDKISILILVRVADFKDTKDLN